MSAFQEWRALLGDRALLGGEQYGENVTGFAQREIRAVLRPISRSEIQQIVKIAAKYRAPLYPFSTGHNWGLGSKLPVESGCALLDLSSMNRILEINEEFQYAIVEPGVTQRQLADALAQTSCMLNVTGSAGRTSVMGNILERGVGVLGQRTQELRGLEAILADGQLVRTGHWDFDQRSNAHDYPTGVGPDVTGLFSQSGFGVVTRLVVGLHPRQNVKLALLHSTQEALAEHVDILHEFRRNQILRDRIEINREDDPRIAELGSRSRSSTWMTWLTVWGDEPLQSALQEIIAVRFPNLNYYSSTDANLPDSVETRFRKLAGDPGDEYVNAMAGHAISMDSAVALDHDMSFPGFVCVLPAIPFTGRHVRAALDVVRESDLALGVTSNVTFNSINAHGLEGFFRLMFDRHSQTAISTAHHWARETQQKLARAGFRPTRTSVDNMFYTSGHSDMTMALKQAIDPEGIISPGRYVPASPN
ncbi:MAG: FAD-binding oxidoreductase [Corynebacteriales bacterium]|nr:FAD-binding oxidoreductase [Mycobacteriales bacterium]